MELLVAPPAGAWIETARSQKILPHSPVAPPAGAWIETEDVAALKSSNECRAPRGRVD